MPKLRVLLPAYNESAHIADVVREIRQVRIDGVDLSVMVVDDGSRDDTARLAAEAGALVLRHPRNRGVGAAFRSGRDAAWSEGVDYLLHMDSDGQVLPSEIPRLVAPVLSGAADLAIGSRFLAAPPAHLAWWKAQGLHSLARTVGLATGYRLHDMSCGFRCMNRRILEVVSPTFDYDYIQETLIQALAAQARVEEVPVTVRYDPTDEGGMSAGVLRYGSRFVGLTAFALARFYRARSRG
jgi:glycosyltransferase involved in cell wall biosynthesis